MNIFSIHSSLHKLDRFDKSIAVSIFSHKHENIKSTGATDAHENSCTILSMEQKKLSKRGPIRANTRNPGSESSFEVGLSYLDLDTGRILSAAREHDTVLSLAQNSIP